MNSEKKPVGQSVCDCGKKNAPKVWCYIHGYLIKPPLVERPTLRRPNVQPTSR